MVSYNYYKNKLLRYVCSSYPPTTQLHVTSGKMTAYYISSGTEIKIEYLLLPESARQMFSENMYSNYVGLSFIIKTPRERSFGRGDFTHSKGCS